VIDLPNSNPDAPVDAFLLVSFGGPERQEDVLPYLELVLRGRRVPEARKREVAEHYAHFGGCSPINAQNRALLGQLREQLSNRADPLPVYWANRNWHPLIPDTLRQMAQDGIRHALTLITSPFSSYSSCRQYLEALAGGRAAVGAAAPQLSKLRAYFNHPHFVAAWQDRITAATADWTPRQWRETTVLFTAHSIPVEMAGCDRYVAQVNDLAHVLAARFPHPVATWRVVYQSRSGRPGQPWLEPDVCAAIEDLHANDPPPQLLLIPIGFVSDHIEVLYDLDVEASRTAARCGIPVTRVQTVGTHPRMVQLVSDLIDERLSGRSDRPTVGQLGPAPDQCPADCCLPASSVRRE